MTRGEYMAEARRKAGLSQADLAAMAGIWRVTVARLESGRSDAMLSTAELLADALGISIDEYIGHEVVRKDGTCTEGKSIWQTLE